MKCPYCKKEFEASPGKKFCSDRCRYRFHHSSKQVQVNKLTGLPNEVRRAKTVKIIDIPDPDAWIEIGRILPKMAAVEMLESGYFISGTKIRVCGKNFKVRGKELSIQKLVSC